MAKWSQISVQCIILQLLALKAFQDRNVPHLLLLPAAFQTSIDFWTKLLSHPSVDGYRWHESRHTPLTHHMIPLLSLTQKSTCQNHLTGSPTTI